MATPDDVLCGEWAAMLRYWVNTATTSFHSGEKPKWALDEAAFERVKPILAAAKPEDLAILFSEFGVGLLHSLLVSLAQGPIHVAGPSLALVEAETGERLGPGLNERFLVAAMREGLLG